MQPIVSLALARGERFLRVLPDLPVHAVPRAEAIRAHLAERYGFEQPIGAEELIDDVAGMLERWAVHVVHPRYFGYFNPTPLDEAVAADLLTAVFNPQLAVWSHAPAAVEMEQHVLRWVGGRLGLPAHGSGAHFTSGGSEANFTAVVAALTRTFPDYARSGLRRQELRPTVYHSEGAHDSFTKICHMTGIGRDALRPIPVDASLRMDVEALRRQLEADLEGGCRPVLVAATAGTTAAGVIDPLARIGAVCRELGVWFHVDAAWGGAALLSPRLRGHFQGIEAADSITCDAHKWFNVTMGAGMFFCRDASVLEEAFRVTTDYMPDVSRGSIDPFATSAQWSRRFIGLKLFLALASLGESGFAGMIERQAELGSYMREQLASAGWVHLSASPLPVCCFTHPAFEGDEAALDSVLATVLARGQAWISKVALGGRRALRACVTSRLATRADVDTLISELSFALMSLARN